MFYGGDVGPLGGASRLYLDTRRLKMIMQEGDWGERKMGRKKMKQGESGKRKEGKGPEEPILPRRHSQQKRLSSGDTLYHHVIYPRT